MKDGTQKKLTIPDDWKVTFGPLVPGSKDGSLNSAGAVALRMWSGNKGKEIQHAVFTNVESFRDTSIEIMEQKEEVKSERYVREGDESGEAIQAEVRVKKWIDPDATPEQRPANRASVDLGGGADTPRLIQLVR
jgi:hypothetical protein